MDDLLALIIVLIICIVVTRWVFSIPTIVTQLKKQTDTLNSIENLLMKFAEKNGLSSQELMQIQQISRTENPAGNFNNNRSRDVDKAIRDFVLFLNDNWNQVNNIASKDPAQQEKLQSWIQGIWELMVENIVLKPGNYFPAIGTGFFNALKITTADAQYLIRVKPRKNTQLYDMLNNEDMDDMRVYFSIPIAFENNTFKLKPPFGHVLCQDILNKQRVFRLDDVIFDIERM